MRKKLLEVVENYVDWIQIQFEDDVNFVGDDYIDSVEDMFEDGDFPYSQDDLQEAMKEIIHRLKEEFGNDNVYYNAPDHTIADNGRHVTIYKQLIVKNKNKTK
ncbi:hypothetical protein BC30048_4423 [Bacillus cereus]|uniref:hypothetical protein n=1 Tax=Bacillus cereus group TaxID=86661 RepID=UPI0007A93050|nr:MULTISPECIES: hypothetical protein [Bacillus cereus group]KYQ00957.1 hypothetical protein B4079_3874 [Bacillus cereus]MED1214301.1 hypothetical protein [Bacillus paranthracis]BCC13998.1 hypothetical protein BCM0074_4381 [Bacillus cereus]BCD01521.1 hypothetical protein BC30048_4423 [Bacillus cereus]